MATTAMRAAVVAIGVVAMGVGVSDLWLVLSGRFAGRPSGYDTRDS